MTRPPGLGQEPTKLRDLQDRFMAEAAKYNVLPLDDRFAQRADPSVKPSHLRGKTSFVYPPGTIRVGERSSPNTKNVHHTLAAEVEISEGGAEGVLVCCGGLAGGYSVFLKDGRLHWEHNYYNEVHYRVSSAETIPPGHHVLSAEVKVDEEGTFGTGGDVTLRLGKSKIGDGRFDKQVAGFFHGQRKLRRRLATPARPSRNCTNHRSPSPAPSSRCGGYQ